jgi:hypothetical protein
MEVLKRESQEDECFHFSEETAKREDVQKLLAFLDLDASSGLELDLD